MRQLILASASPRRKELLQQIGLRFEIVPSNVDESFSSWENNPHELVKRLAFEKASEVAGRFENGIVLGADTIVVVEGQIFGKPCDEPEAQKMLKILSGKDHVVMTGISLVDAKSKKSVLAYEETKVFLDPLSDLDILRYISTGEPFGKAGAYAIQGFGALFVRKIEGCYNNVVGLPLNLLGKLLKNFGVSPLQQS